MNNAIYEVINNGENSYYYTHHGGNCVTGPLRLDQAIEYAQHNDIGSTAFAFVGTRGVQLGWLASQADMLAYVCMIIIKEE